MPYIKRRRADNGILAHLMMGVGFQVTPNQSVLALSIYFKLKSTNEAVPLGGF